MSFLLDCSDFIVHPFYDVYILINSVMIESCRKKEFHMVAGLTVCDGVMSSVITEILSIK